jgi:hypothetical protein
MAVEINGRLGDRADGALEVAGPRRERPRGLPPLNAALTVLNRDFMEAGL